MKLHSVPRRFDLVTLLVVTLAYAVLFGALRLMRLGPKDIGQVGGFVTCVGIGQALLFGGKRPRVASMLVGVVCLVGIYLASALTADASLLEFHYLALPVWMSIAICGAISGYFAGVAIGLVFLVSDTISTAMRQRKRR